jgi:hypothetical protein
VYSALEMTAQKALEAKNEVILYFKWKKTYLI